MNKGFAALGFLMIVFLATTSCPSGSGGMSWKTYTGDVFKINYPSTWVVTEYSGAVFITDSTENASIVATYGYDENYTNIDELMNYMTSLVDPSDIISSSKSGGKGYLEINAIGADGERIYSKTLAMFCGENAVMASVMAKENQRSLIDPIKDSVLSSVGCV